MANRKDIFNIMQQEEKLKSIDKAVFDTYGEIGRLNSLKMQLKRKNGELMKGIDHYDSVLMEKYMETIYNDK